MTDPSVQTKPAGDLVADDWIDLSTLEPEARGDAVVGYVERYSGRVDRALVVVRGAGREEPWPYRVAADRPVRLLSAEEIERVKDWQRREQLALQFVQLAEMARRHDVFPRNDMLIFTLKTRAEVRAVGEALGLEPRDQYNGGLAVSWPRGHESYDDGLHVLWNTGEKEPEPAPTLVMDAERGHVPAEHFHAGGQAGEPGACAAWCNCGVTFDGFDTVTEAAALVYRHVADPDGLNFTRDDVADEVDAARPVSPGRGGAPQVGAVTEAGLVDETPAEPSRIVAEAADFNRSVAANTLYGHAGRVTDQGQARTLADLEQIQRDKAHAGWFATGDTSQAEAEPVTVYFSFGHGQTDPDTGKNLIDHYVTIVGQSHEACRKAMFASKYGARWAFDYLKGDPESDKWIARWTEHERIVLAADAVDDEPMHYRDSDSDGDQVVCGVRIDDIDGWTTRIGSATCPACVAAMTPVVDPTGQGRESDPDWVAGFGPVPGSDLIGEH